MPSHDSIVVRMLSPIICFLFLITTVNVPAVASKVESHQQNSKAGGSGACAASNSSSKQRESSLSNRYPHKIGDTENETSFGLVAGETSESAPGYSSGCGSAAKHRERTAEVPIVARVESDAGKTPCLTRKTGTVRANTEALTEGAVKFNVPEDPAVLILTLYWPDSGGEIRQDLQVELRCPSGKPHFSMQSGRGQGLGLLQMTAQELDSTARLDFDTAVEALADYEQVLIVNEEMHRALLVVFTPTEGTWQLLANNLAASDLSYRLVSIPLRSTSPTGACSDCLSGSQVAADFILEVACSVTPYVAAVLICVAAVKLAIVVPLLAPILVAICYHSVNFVVQFDVILGQIVCHLTPELRQAAATIMAAWFCTVSGACSDQYPPLVFLQSPNGGEYHSGPFNIVATVAGEASGIDYVEFDYSTDGGATWSDVVGPGHPDGRVCFEGAGSIVFDTETAGVVYSNTMKVRVRARDTEGNLSDWDESDDVFTVDNSSESPTSISVTENLSPNPCNAYQSVTVFGTSHYNTGSPVTNATATIEILQTDATWTAPLDPSGNYIRDIAGPSSPGSYTVEVTVDDGVLEGSTSRTLSVQSGDDGNNYDFVRSTTCRNVQSSSPYDPIDEKEFFRSDDAQVCVWLHLSDVYLNSDPPPFVRVKWNFYQPDGNLYWTSTYDIPDSDPYDYWAWYKCWASIYVSGHNAADLEGKWSCKVYVDEGSGYEYLTTEGFTIRYEFDEHLMAHDVQDEHPWEPINPTNSFCHNDEKALTWARINNVCEGLEIKWEFYEPNGSLYFSFPYSIPDPGVGTPEAWWKFWGWINILGHAAQHKTGNWHVNVFIQDAFSNWDLEYTDYFEIKECPDVNPSVLVSAVPSNPYEGDAISLAVSATDNGYLQRVTLHWNDGSWNSETWSDLKANGFDTSLAIGSYPTPVLIRYYATAEDADANDGISEQKVVMVQDIDVEGPQITSGLVAVNGGNSNGRIEDCEQVRISFLADDPNGVDSVAVIVDSTDLIVQGSYYAVGGPYDAGSHIVSVLAIDGDVPPAANIWVDTFFVDPVPDGPQAIIVPLDGDTVYAAPVVFTWLSLPTADSGYEMQVDTAQTFDSDILFVETLRSRTDTSLQVQVIPNETYYWRLASRSYCGQSGYSEPWHFFTSWTGVGEENDELTTPERFALLQNHPNPFNPETEITYFLPRSCEVTLTIYNVRGQKVRLLVNESQSPGSRWVKWDGRNDQGRGLTSGVYFYRIQAGDFVQCKKMVLMK